MNDISLGEMRFPMLEWISSLVVIGASSFRKKRLSDKAY